MIEYDIFGSKGNKSGCSRCGYNSEESLEKRYKNYFSNPLYLTSPGIGSGSSSNSSKYSGDSK